MTLRDWRKIVAAVALAGAFAGNADARERVDRNNDGVLQGEEIATAYKNNKAKREAAFTQLDADKNGTLSRAEVGNDKAFKELNTDGDDVITKNEFLYEIAENTTKKLDQVDSNNDGNVDQGEANSAAKRWKKKRGN
jgi:hypothetical protein